MCHQSGGHSQDKELEDSKFLHCRGEMSKAIDLLMRPSQKKITGTRRSAYWFHVGEMLMAPREAFVLPSNASVAGSEHFFGKGGR